MANNEVRKFKSGIYTLDSRLVGESLKGISLLNNKEPYCIVGGIATQSYLPAFCRRPTFDIDVLIIKPMNYDDFRNLSKPLIEYFSDKGYKTDWKKYSRSFALKLSEGDNKLLIEFSRRNGKNFKKSKKILERKLKNSKKKTIGVSRAECYVIAPEDIFVPKLVRCVGSLFRNPQLKKTLPKNKEISPNFIISQLKLINDLREYAILNPGNLETAEELRFISDIYDMNLLYKLSKLRKRYLKESMNDWDALTEKKSEKETLINFIFDKE